MDERRNSARCEVVPSLMANDELIRIHVPIRKPKLPCPARNVDVAASRTQQAERRTGESTWHTPLCQRGSTAKGNESQQTCERQHARARKAHRQPHSCLAERMDRRWE